MSNLVLVLNKSWIPIQIENYKKSFLKVCKEKALFIPDNNFNTLTYKEWIKIYGFKRPKIVLLKDFNKIVTKSVRPTRKNIMLRDKYTCQYTGKVLPKHLATLDHVIPLSLGGKSNFDNLVCCDIKVNVLKANRTPEQAGLTLIKIPKRPQWQPLNYVSEGSETYKSWQRFIKNK